MNEGLSIVAGKYAEAMAQLAEKNDLFDNINADLTLLKDMVKSSEELGQFIEHPLINSEDKKEVLEKLFKEHITLVSLNMLRVLADNNRLYLLPLIADGYNTILCKMRNIDTAQVITAVPIDENTVNRVKDKLERLFNKHIKIEPQVDEEIIAGMIVKIRDKIIDGSVKTKFENMKKQLIHS